MGRKALLTYLVILPAIVVALLFSSGLAFAKKAPGTYGTANLMVVVERDPASILIIDGTDHEVVGRVKLPGAKQPHAPVFSPDGRYYYVMGRNGLYFKVDLLKQKVVAKQKIGEDSRGSAITPDGRYVVAGNYKPGTAVIMDARDLKILKVIKGPKALAKGKVIRSRAASITDIGGVKNLMAIAWKEAGEVWVVDMNNPKFPVIKKFKGAGAMLHDSFVTEDGRYYMLAAQASNHMWIMDAYKLEYLGTISTRANSDVPGKIPHPGPGACVEDICFTPNVGTGTVTAYRPATVEFVKNIPTTGAKNPGGLFIRKHPGAKLVVADAVFHEGKKHSKVYVIDAETLEVVKKLNVGPGAVHPEFTARGVYLYVSSWGGNKVVVFDGKTFKKIKEIPAKTPTSIINSGRTHENGL